MLRGFAVILQRLDARGFFVRTDQRQITNLQQLRGGEEHHVHRVVVDGIAQASLVEHQRAHARAPRFDGRGQPGWARANADNVVICHRFSVCREPRGIANRASRNYWTGFSSKMDVSSRRNVSSSCKRSGEAAISFFFQTKTSLFPRFSFTLKLPSTM